MAGWPVAEPVRAILTDLEGVAVPAAFMSDTLIPLARERLGAYIAGHAEDEEVEDALEEAGRLFGGFTLKLEEAEALFLRWMKQDRKATPLKVLQGLIWQEAYQAGTITPALYPDVAGALRAWSAAGLRLFVYSSSSELAQKALLAHLPEGDLGGLFEGFLDTATGQKIEPGSYTLIAERLGLPPASILVLSDNEEELDAAREAGCATRRVARDGAVASGHPVAADLATLAME